MEGTLTGFSLSEVIEMLSHKKKTGVLSIDSSSEGSGRIWFSEGQVHSAETPAFESRETGDKKNRGQTEDILKDAMLEITEWEESVYSFEVGEVSVSDSDHLFEVDKMLDEVARRSDEWERIKAEIPSQAVKVELISEMKEDSISLSREQWELVAMVGKSKTVDSLRQALEISRFQIGRILFSLSKAGLVRCLGELADANPSPIKANTRPKVEAINKKYIRKSIVEDDEAKELIPSEWVSYYQLLDSRNVSARSSGTRRSANN